MTRYQHLNDLPLTPYKTLLAYIAYCERPSYGYCAQCKRETLIMDVTTVYKPEGAGFSFSQKGRCFECTTGGFSRVWNVSIYQFEQWNKSFKSKGF